MFFYWGRRLSLHFLVTDGDWVGRLSRASHVVWDRKKPQLIRVDRSFNNLFFLYLS